MTAPAMAAEFDDVTGWTAEAVEELGRRHAIPAACRGSASPAALAWPAEAGALSPGMTLLDVGAGAGGRRPGAWGCSRPATGPTRPTRWRPARVSASPTCSRPARSACG
ncbi:hypothetical protein GCM10023334_003870 [Nonomuraea thailandensis]